MNVGSFRKLVEERQQQQKLENDLPTMSTASSTPIKNYTLKELLGEDDDDGSRCNSIAVAAAAAERAAKNVQSVAKSTRVDFLTCRDAIVGVKAKYGNG